MKKIIAGVAILFLGLLGFLGYELHEKNVQDEIYEEAAVFFREEDYKKAIQYFKEAASHNNVFSGNVKKDLIYYEAEGYMKLEEYEEALALYDGLIKDYPSHSIPYVMKAHCFSVSDQKENAAKVYEEAYKKTKEEIFLYYLADLYVTMGSCEDALEIIHTYRGKDGETERKLGFLEIIICEKQNQYKEAYEKAVLYCENYPEDELGRKELEFLKTR